MSVVDWLLDSDPSIRWQAMRDLAGASETQWSAERAGVETEGWGARLLSLQDEDGQWAGGAYFPGDFDWDGPEAQPGRGQPWTATSHSLSQLRDFGLDPASRAAVRAVRLIGENCRWEHAGQPFWEGEVEPCINGITVANGSYFGVDVTSIVDRLLDERLADGGWNCDVDSVRTSYDTTINVLEGLLEYERNTGGTAKTREARRAAEEFLLERRLYQRLSTGEPADEDFLLLRNPPRWQYDVLRALDYLRSAGLHEDEAPDPRIETAVEHILSKRTEDGNWLLDKIPKGRSWFDVDDGPGRPSRWITLRARRVLDWAGLA